MKRKINLFLLLMVFLCFSTAAGAEQSMLWPDNAGFDPTTGEGWKINVGTLDGWQVSNFETLEYQTAGKSEVVGTGITVDGIQVDWKYPGSDSIGKGEDLVGEGRLDQSIDYTVVAFAEIPCVLKMNVIGNGGGNGSNNEFALLNEENEIPEMDLMVFSPSMGGIVDGSWNFTVINAVGYAAGEAQDSYINACDLWTADIWANVPYGFAVSSTGMGDLAGLESPLVIEMRYLERLGDSIASQETNLSSLDSEVDSNSNWAGDFDLTEDGVEVGQYEAGQNAHINMQFRVPVTGAPAGRYQGEVTFSTYTI